MNTPAWIKAAHAASTKIVRDEEKLNIPDTRGSTVTGGAPGRSAGCGRNCSQQGHCFVGSLNRNENMVVIIARDRIARDTGLREFAADYRNESDGLKARVNRQGNQAGFVRVGQAEMLGIFALDDCCQPLSLPDGAKGQ
jgi:hypothetical protein